MTLRPQLSEDFSALKDKGPGEKPLEKAGRGLAWTSIAGHGAEGPWWSPSSLSGEFTLPAASPSLPASSLVLSSQCSFPLNDPALAWGISKYPLARALSCIPGTRRACMVGCSQLSYVPLGYFSPDKSSMYGFSAYCPACSCFSPSPS